MNPVDHPMGGGEGKASGGTPFKISKGKVSGTMQAMGAAKKGGKYTWI